MSKNFKQDATSGDVQLGRRGPRIIVSGGSIRFRNANNSLYTTGEVANPTADDQIANKRYVDDAAGFTGMTLLDFGPFPGVSDTVAIVLAPAILADSLVEAWIFPMDTADHSFHEHIVDPPEVIAGGVGAGFGFTIYGTAKSSILSLSDPAGVRRIDESPRVYGTWNVAWRWK